MFSENSEITIGVLEYFFLNPKKTCYINELANILGLDVGNLCRKLKKLEEEGILYSERRGNQRYYGLNQKYHLLKEVRRIHETKYGFVNSLKEKLKNIKGLKEAYIFGSYAEGNLQQESDIDILLIGSHSSIEARRTILPLQKNIGREINIVDFSINEFETRKVAKDDFIKNIFSRKKIKIY